MMGSNTPLIAEDSAFSWSHSRRAIYEFCPRAYFYKYYGAIRGWDKFSPEKTSKLYLLKNIKKAEQWLEDILSKAVIKIFLENRIKADRNILSKHLCFEVIKNYNRDWIRIRRGEWRKDPKLPNIFELYYKTDPDFLRKKQDIYLNKLLMALNCLIQNPFFEELRAVPFLSWKHLRRPDSFFINGICVWCAPDLAWMNKGELNILKLKLAKPEKTGYAQKETSKINALMARTRYKLPLNKIKCLTFYFEAEDTSEALECFEPEDLTQTVKEIEESAMEMRSKISHENKLYESDFSKRECNAENFDFCEFMEYCEEYGY